MRIGLINTSSKKIKNSVKDLLYGCWCQGKRIGGSSFPPLNLLSLGTILEKDNIVRIIDNHILNLNQNQLIQYLSNFELIILPTTSFCYEEDVSFLQKVKKMNPTIKCIIYGSFPTVSPAKSLKSDIIDIAILGEPDQVITKIVDSIENNKNLKNIRGICYRKNSKIINTGRVRYIKNLDELPIPNRDYIKDIYYFNPLVKNRNWTTALTSRGCPSLCNFCLSPVFYGKKYRCQTPHRMIKEVRYLLNEGYKEIFYRDETFTGNRKRIEKFCKNIIEQKLKFDWICNIKVNTVDKNLLKLMKVAGCHYIKIGVESGSQRILNNLKKGITLNQIQKTFKWAKSFGIKTHAHMMLGCLGETKHLLKTPFLF
ncbi:MAG: B12-binding domain-containing radical SAM protein [Nanoarchaeota archaeon]